MSTKWKAKHFIAVTAVVALALSACGSSADSADTTTAGSAPTSAGSSAGSSAGGTPAATADSGASTPESSAPEAAAPPVDADIDPDAVLRFTSAGPIRNLDPALQTSYGGWGYLALAWDRLIMLDTKDELIPGLATEWNFSKDGATLELKLRDDVMFHDGTPFNAEAVKVNIERGQTLTDSAVKADLTDITSVEVIDDYTVSLTLAAGRGVQLPSTFATNVGMMVSPKAITDGVDLANNPGTAGSGPYVITAFTPNEKVSMVRADSYWDPTAGRLAGVELERVPEATTRLNGVQTGLTDLSFVSSPNDLAQATELATQGQIVMQTTQFRNVVGVYLRANQGALVNEGVRQAIAHSIDPDAINALFSGTCTPHQQLYPAGSWPEIPDYTYPYGYDVEKAKSLIAAAGGAKVTVTFAAGTNAEQPANVIQSQMAAAGIDAQLNPVPNSENEPRFIAGDFELMVATSFSPKIDPAASVNTYFLNTYKLAADPSLIEADATKAADPTLTQAERAPLYAKIWETALEQVWFVPICQLTNGAIANDKVIGIDNIPWANIGIWDLRNVAMKK